MGEGEAASRVGGRRDQVVEYPFVGSPKPVPPDRMVKAGDTQARVVVREPVATEDRIEDRIVARIGERRTVHCLVVGKRPPRLEPQCLAR